MAWIKEITHPDHGAVASFWETISIHYDKRRQLSTLQVGGWVGEQAYNDNLSPLLVKIYEIPSGLAPELASGAEAFIASYVRGQEEFEGSQDV